MSFSDEADLDRLLNLLDGDEPDSSEFKQRLWAELAHRFDHVRDDGPVASAAVRVAVRVLLAEPEALTRLDLREILTEEGYEVVGDAADGGEIVDLIRQTRPDVTILDTTMPGFDGLAVARQITGDRMCAVVVVSTQSQREQIAAARDAGVGSYLLKPFRSQDVVPAIEIAVARFRDLDVLAKERESLSERLATRRIIDQAKSRLQRTFSLSEQDAFRFIQRTATARRTSMKLVASAVLAGEIEPER